jgi:hypothetical protein
MKYSPLGYYAQETDRNNSCNLSSFFCLSSTNAACHFSSFALLSSANAACNSRLMLASPPPAGPTICRRNLIIIPTQECND